MIQTIFFACLVLCAFCVGAFTQRYFQVIHDEEADIIAVSQKRNHQHHTENKTALPRHSRQKMPKMDDAGDCPAFTALPKTEIFVCTASQCGAIDDDTHTAMQIEL